MKLTRQKLRSIILEVVLQEKKKRKKRKNKKVDYKKAYKKYHSSKKAKRERAQRNAAGRKLKKLGVKIPSGYEIDHKKAISYGGSNDLSNLRWCDRSTNCQNRRIFKNNTSGFKNISQRKESGSWKVHYQKYKIQKTFKTKKEALCYKFIIQLRIKANHFQ